jgi:ribosome-associated protein
MTPEELGPDQMADVNAALAADKKAIDIVALDLRGVAGYTDFFLVCSGNTDRQTKAIHDGVHLGMKNEHGILPRRVEGVGESRWILMDYLDVVVHVFTPETRDFYRLEQLWGDVPRREYGPDGERLDGAAADADADAREGAGVVSASGVTPA